MPLSNFGEVTPIVAPQLWLPADGTNFKIIIPFQPTPFRLDTLIAVNDDNAARVVNLILRDTANNIHAIGQVSVPALTGHAPNPAIDLFGLLFPAVQSGIAFTTTLQLEASMVAAVTSALGLVAYGGYF